MKMKEFNEWFSYFIFKHKMWGDSLERRSILFGLTILLFSTLFFQEPIIFRVAAQGTELNYNMIPDIECLHLVEDTNFTETPILGTNGTSNEFSTDYGTDIEAEVFNYVELTWEHPPSPTIDRRDDYRYSDQEPPSWEYAYFATTFEWTEDVFPVSCLSVLECEIQTTGGFSTPYAGQSMYQINVLLIDSNGKIANLHSEEFLDDAPFGFYSNQLSSWVIEYAWEDMIADEEGNQTAPTDIAEIRVILTPSNTFFEHADPVFSGSVTVRFRYFDLQTLADISPQAEIIEPRVIGSAGVNSSINYVETARSPNGTFFTLGRTHLIPDWGVIVKWNQEGQPSWIQEWSDDAPEGIAADDEFVYTVGQQNGNLSLAIWSHSGVLLDEILYNLIVPSYGLEVGVFQDGRLGILGYRRNQTQFIGTFWSLNPNYSINWSTTVAIFNSMQECQLWIHEDSSSYAKCGNAILNVSADTYSRTTMTYATESFVATGNQFLWCTRGEYAYTEPQYSARRDLRISKFLYSETGTEEYVLKVHFKYSPNFYDSVWYSNIAIDANADYLYILAEKGVSYRQYIVTKMKLDGEVSFCKSIENGGGSTLPVDWKKWYDIEVLDDRSIGVFGEDLQGDELKLTMAIFNLGAPYWAETIDWFIIGIVVGAVVIADIGIIYYMKRRKQPAKKSRVDLDKVFDEVFEK